MDRISYLPQSILHDILSRLPDKDAARTIVLSKAWQDTWSTFPFLVFDESRYERTQIPNGADIRLQMTVSLLDKYKFCQLVTGRLSRFLCKGLAIRKFKLVFKSFTPPDALSFVNDWMRLACASGVEVLQLDNGFDMLQLENPRSSDSYDEFACLPLCVLETKSLIKLELSWYFRVDQAFLNHPIKFSALQVLSLTHVYFGDEQVIQNIISSCPLIEKLVLFRCYGLKSVSIHGLPKLKVVFIEGIEELDVDAPSLEDIFYDASGFETVNPRTINMDKCTNLRELCLVYVTSIFITDHWFIQLFKKFPLLEKLVLEGFNMSEMINISSIQLKVLDLCNCFDLEEIDIDAPNLYEFKYHGDGSILPSISILNGSSQLVLNIVFFVDFLLHLEDLRTFLNCTSPVHIPVSLFLGFRDDSTVEFDPFELPDYPIGSPSIKHMALYADSDTKEFSLLLVTSLFWSCRPSIVSFSLNANKTLVKVCHCLFRYYFNVPVTHNSAKDCFNVLFDRGIMTYLNMRSPEFLPIFVNCLNKHIFCEKLIRRKGDHHCCSSTQLKCWWHFLKDVKVSSSFRNHNAADEFKTLLEAFPTISSEEEEEISRFKERGDINFWLEWQL